MKYVKYLALLATLSLLSPLCALARDKNQHSVDISDFVQVGATHLKPGNYKVEWQEAGPAVYVKFLQRGKTVATAPATLKMNDAQVTQDDVVIQKTSASQKVLEEIDFGRQKEALVFAQHKHAASFRIGSKFRCIRSTPTHMQSMNEDDFECFAGTGVNRQGNGPGLAATVVMDKNSEA